jgi:hypothetical protein
VTLFSVMEGYRRFRELCCLHLQGIFVLSFSTTSTVLEKMMRTVVSVREYRLVARTISDVRDDMSSYRDNSFP